MKHFAILCCAVALAGASALPCHAAAIEDGLLVHLTFDKADGDTVEDTSGGGHDGTLSSGAAIVTDEVASGTGSLRIEGGDNRVEVESFAALETYEDNTFLFWLRFPAAATGSLGIHYRYEPGNLGFWGLGPEGDNTHFELNQWYHVAGTTSGGELVGYVDGEAKAKIAVAEAFIQGDGGLFVGNSPAYAGPAANFYMDELAV